MRALPIDLDALAARVAPLVVARLAAALGATQAPYSTRKGGEVPGGEEEYFRAKLAGGRQVRVLFQGEPPTRAIIDKLIAHLELMREDK